MELLQDRASLDAVATFFLPSSFENKIVCLKDPLVKLEKKPKNVRGQNVFFKELVAKRKQLLDMNVNVAKQMLGVMKESMTW